MGGDRAALGPIPKRRFQHPPAAKRNGPPFPYMFFQKHCKSSACPTPPSRPSPHPAEHSQSRGPAALGTTAGPNPCSCFSKSYSVPGYPGVPLLPTSPRDRPPELVNRGHTNAGNARDPGDRFLHSPVRSRASLCQPHSCRGEAVELFPLSHPA